MHYPARGGVARAAHAVHQLAGRLRGRLPVLRDRRARASSGTSRPRRSSTRSATPPGALAADGKRLTNVVYMGMGEPLLNLDRVLESIAALNDPRRLGLGARHITVSHLGRRARDPAPDRARAAVHARRQPPRRAQRAARRAGAAQPALAGRGGRRGRPRARRVDRPPRDLRGDDDRRASTTPTLDADALADLLRGDHAHVNLIPMNQVAHTPWTGTPIPVIERFAGRLRAAGIETTIRINRGTEIGAACGQLAAEHAGAARADRRPAPPRAARRRERGGPARRAQPRPGPGRGGGGDVSGVSGEAAAPRAS